jgi:rubrerythrin
MGISFNADEVFEMGMDIEQNGEAYYRKAVELTEDPDVKKIFEELMVAEQAHYETFKKLRENLPAKDTTPIVSDPEDQSYLYLDALVKSRLFNSVREAEEVVSKATGPIEALQGALTFEKDTILFFTEMKGRTREDLGKTEIDRLIAEEREHIVWISVMIKKIREREVWS